MENSLEIINKFLNDLDSTNPEQLSTKIITFVIIVMFVYSIILLSKLLDKVYEPIKKTKRRYKQKNADIDFRHFLIANKIGFSTDFIKWGMSPEKDKYKKIKK